jgi:uncharacterized protein
MHSLMTIKFESKPKYRIFLRKLLRKSQMRSSLLAAIMGLTLLSGCQQAPQLTMAAAPPSTVMTASQQPGEDPTAIPATPALTAVPDLSPLAISAMQAKAYPGSDLVMESTLSAGPDYNRYIVSYQSDGLKLYGLLTVPTGVKPAEGWPVILLNHGYIPPDEYSTDRSYAEIVAPLAAAGYIVFKPDYRGHDNSPGIPYQVYVSPAYVTDSLNALASIEKYKDANPSKIGVWGHSMGGNVTLHELVLTHDFKAAVIMAGVVGSYSAILDWWKVRVATGVLTTQNDLQTEQLLQQMVALHGTPQTNPGYWDAIDPTFFISAVQTPVQIQVGSADVEVPQRFSQDLAAQLQNAGKSVAYHLYPGADHNLSPDTSAAMAEAVAFFNQYLK